MSGTTWNPLAKTVAPLFLSKRNEPIHYKILWMIFPFFPVQKNLRDGNIVSASDIVLSFFHIFALKFTKPQIFWARSFGKIIYFFASFLGQHRLILWLGTPPHSSTTCFHRIDVSGGHIYVPVHHILTFSIYFFSVIPWNNHAKKTKQWFLITYSAI